MPQSRKKNKLRWSTVHWSIYPQGELNVTENVAMVWINTKNTYDMVPQSWIINCLKTYKLSDKVIKFIAEDMKKCKVELIAGGNNLTKVEIQGGIFQGDALSPLLLVIRMMPLNYILRESTEGNAFIKLPKKIIMDDIKLFGKMKRNWRL